MQRLRLSASDTVLTSEQVQDIVGAMFTSNTETRISATYEDSDGTIDLVVDAIPVDLTSDGAGTIHANNVPTLNQDTTGNADTATAAVSAQRITGPTDSDVSIISDGEVTVKLDSDNDESNQKFKITNNADSVVFSVQEDGNLQIDGDLTIDGNNLTNNATTANFNIASSRILELQHAGAYDIQLGNSTNADVLKVQGDSEVVTVNGALNVTGIITGKRREVFFQNFFDDLGTTKHYLPFKSQSEQTTIYQEEAAVIMPCDGRIVSITLRVNFPNADGNVTMGIHTRPVNVSAFSTASWVEEETETLALQNADDSHAFHFAFDNAKHFESSELVSISMQCDADISANAYWYVSTVVEYDWSTFLGTTSAEIDSTP